MKRRYYGEYYKTDSHFRRKEVIQFTPYESLNTKDCMLILLVVLCVFLSLFTLWR